MADKGLGEHPALTPNVSISSSEAVGSQGISGSSLVLPTSSSFVSDRGLAASRCSKSGVDWVSLSSSWLDMEAEGASSNGCQGASRCSKVGVDHYLTGMVVEGVSSSSLKLADCEVDGNERHTRSNVECPGTEESAAQIARLTGEGGSNTVSTTEDKATSGELATGIGKAEGRGSKAASTTEDKAASWELATNIGKAKGGGSEAAPTTEDKATSWKLATNIVCKPTSNIFKAMAEMVNSKGGGTIADKRSEKLSIMSNPDSPYIIDSNQATTILNAIGLVVYIDLDEEHLTTRKMSIIGDNYPGESTKNQTPAENVPNLFF
eukprot:10478338-Ditylum_brightwellii.AAC.1